MTEQISLLDIVKKRSPQREANEPPVNWVDRKSLKPGMEWEGTVEAWGEKTDQFEWKGEQRQVNSSYLILTHEDGTKTGMKFSYSSFRRLLKAAELKPGDKVKIRYLGTMSQLEVLNPELYEVLKEMEINPATKLFDMPYIERAPEPEEVPEPEENLEEIKEEIEKLEE